jgi:uncharacterized damage-inducible protein DinB
MDLSYPIGRFQTPESVAPQERKQHIETIAALPARLREAVQGLNDPQLDTPYRPGGWTVRQLVHHVADSHLNSYSRFRMALTETEPAITAYDEKKWAELADARTLPVESSLQMLEGLHSRWVTLLECLSESDFLRTFRHPENGLMRLDRTVALYAWHSKHHLAHVEGLKSRMGW